MLTPAGGGDEPAGRDHPADGGVCAGRVCRRFIRSRLVAYVWKVALAIQEREGGSRFVVELAALLHDLDDWKLHPAADGSPRRAAAWLRELDVEEALITLVS